MKQLMMQINGHLVKQSREIRLNLYQQAVLNPVKALL